MTDSNEAGPLTIDQDLEQEAEGTDAAEDRSRMSFLDHLDELRKRIIYSLYALIACCLVAFFFWEKVFAYFVQYFGAYGGHLVYNEPMAGFMFSLQLTVLLGVIAAAPFIFSQLWLFVAPGLYTREKRVVIPFVLCSSLLFFAGAYFGHRLGFPAMWRFFASYEIPGLTYMPALDITFGFYVKVILGLGLTFQMPMLVYFLARFGIVTAKFLVKQFRYAVLIIFIIAAVITPSADVVTQVIFAAPMLVLYILSIGVAWVFGKAKPKELV
jgi:sec-independent protein translocase protein TatC